eukprot:COSAG01_NODE_9711_length_2363_cov_64.269876_1_plen_79_part_10
MLPLTGLRTRAPSTNGPLVHTRPAKDVAKSLRLLPPRPPWHGRSPAVELRYMVTAETIYSIGISAYGDSTETSAERRGI